MGVCALLNALLDYTVAITILCLHVGQWSECLKRTLRPSSLQCGDNYSLLTCRPVIRVSEAHISRLLVQTLFSTHHVHGKRLSVHRVQLDKHATQNTLYHSPVVDRSTYLSYGNNYKWSKNSDERPHRRGQIFFHGGGDNVSDTANCCQHGYAPWSMPKNEWMTT